MKIAETGGPVDSFETPVLQVLNERGQCELGLIEDKMIDPFKILGHRGEERSTRDDLQALALQRAMICLADSC